MWKDFVGDQCEDYEQYSYCTPDGGYGSGWIKNWGEFSDYERFGYSAVEACCVCGGGLGDLPSTTPTRGPPPHERCVDTIDSWVDSDGDTCKNYKNREYCNADGSYGEAWDPSSPFSDYVRACHVCTL